MPVILAMAGDTFLRHLVGARWFDMALRALQFRVRAEQRKMGVLGMIEHPQRPAIAGAAGFALVSQTVLVNVVGGMTADAALRSILEGQTRVALAAADDAMQA